MSRPIEARIDLKALKNNLQRVKNLAPRSRIMAVIKADAYGHGAALLASTLVSEVDGFAVASIDEAQHLVDSGLRHEIHLLSGFHHADELPLVADRRFIPVIHDWNQLELIEKCKLSKPVRVWIKIDTGMHRLGFRPQDVETVVERIIASKNVAEVRFMSHLSCADNEQSFRTEDQLACFVRASDGYGFSRSLANSAGICGWPATHFEWVRPGLMLYGCTPLMSQKEEDLSLTPVMTLRSRIISIKQLRRGDSIGYGADWACPVDMRVGVVACGYGDGYPRSASGRAVVLCRGTRVKVLGRVSMDLLSVDLRDLPDCLVGDPVELWGKNIRVSELAEMSGTISYDLICGVSSRVARVLENDDG